MLQLSKIMIQSYGVGVVYKFFVFLHLNMTRILASLVLLCTLIASGTPLTGFRHITVSDGLPRNGVLTLLPSRLGPVYVGTWDGLFALNGSSVKEIMFTPSSATPVHTVDALSEDENGTLWVSTSEGMMKYDPATGNCTPVQEPLAEASAELTFTDSRGRRFAVENGCDLLVASADSVFRKVYRNDAGIFAITEYDGRILLGGGGGLTIYDADSNSARELEIDYTDSRGLNDRYVTALAVDAENGLWIGTFYGGVNYLPPSSGLFSDFEGLNSRLNGHVISGITRDARGRLWFGVEDSGVACFDPASDTVANYGTEADSPYRLSTSNVQTVFADGSALYVGTAGGGMDVVDTNTMKFKRFRGAVAGAELPRSVLAFARDSVGTIWVGTVKGLFVYYPESERFRLVDEAPKERFHCLTTDRDGTVWAASQGGGLFSFSADGEMRRHDLPSEMIMSVCPTDSVVYVGTEGDGLFALDRASGTAERVAVPASLGERLMVFEIIADGEAVWFSTNKGLMRYTPASRRLEYFTTADGLCSNQFKINSGLKLPDGRILMGSVSGVCAFHPAEIVANNVAPTAFLTDFLVDYKPFEPDSAILVANRIELPAGSDNIEFRFASSSQADPSKNSFEYMLEPYEREWRTVGSQKAAATYGNLRPGTYTFRLRTSNGNGLTGSERRVCVVIPPRGEMSVFVILLCILSILVLLAAGVYVLRRRRVKEVPQQPAAAAEAPCAEPYTAPADSEFLRKLNGVIDAHIDNSALTVDDLATSMAMGRSSFFAKVKELTGQTPKDYLRTVRLSRAADMLASGTLRVNEVAYRVGFASPSYFARRFSERYGVPPAEYASVRLKKS